MTGKIHNLNETFSGRLLGYLVVFIIGTAFAAALRGLLISGDILMAMLVVVLCTFTATGGLLLPQHHLLSRTASACTLFLLGVIATRFGTTVFPDAYLLLAALGIAIIGARTSFHRQYSSRAGVAVRCMIMVTVSLTLASAFLYGALVLARIFWQ